jgi:hypothetical protein
VDTERVRLTESMRREAVRGRGADDDWSELDDMDDIGVSCGWWQAGDGAEGWVGDEADDIRVAAGEGQARDSEINRLYS